MNQHIKKFGCIGCILLIIFLIGISILPIIAVTKAYQLSRSAEQAIADARIFANVNDFENAVIRITYARAQVTQAREQLDGVGFWRDMPGIGIQIRGLEDATTAGLEALDALRDVLYASDAIHQAFHANAYAEIDPSIEPKRSYADLRPEEKRDVLSRLSHALPILRVARDKAELAMTLWARVPQDQLISPILKVMKPLADGLPAMKTALDTSIPLIEVGLPFMGSPNKMRTLIVLQNSDEIRPTGGFIGSLGNIEMDGGDVKDIIFNDVYSIDTPSKKIVTDIPPAPITEHLGVSQWFLRDTNWSPDFPMSAAKILDVYKREAATAGLDVGIPTAVIAVTPAFFKSILELTGPVTTTSGVYTSETFFDKIQYEVEQGFLKKGSSITDRKKVLGELGSAILEKLKYLPSAKWNDAMTLVQYAFERKQLQAYASDVSLLQALDTQGWTGRAKETKQDFLWVIDANLGALKTDGVMDKKIIYTVDAHADDVAPMATVTLEYTNTNKKIDWRYTRYQSYTRVYVPEGSEFVTSTAAHVDVSNELGKKVYGAYWVIEPGYTKKMSFTYRLPQDVIARISSGTYRLDWPKQAGADKTQLTLDVLFGKKIVAASPAEEKKAWGDMKYHIDATSLVDRVFMLQLQP